jgi:hypothetical protein
MASFSMMVDLHLAQRRSGVLIGPRLIGQTADGRMRQECRGQMLGLTQAVGRHIRL